MLKTIKLLLECPPTVVTAKCNTYKKNYYKKFQISFAYSNACFYFGFKPNGYY